MIRHPKREAGNAMMHCDDSSFSLFEAFGLRIRSDLPLGCLSAEGEGEDVVIRLGQVGAGMQIRTADLDADGDVDIVVAGKEGTQILFNRRKN